ncbi:MAG: TonB-dependent receptor [Cyclobacteriaceae bacterium]
MLRVVTVTVTMLVSTWVVAQQFSVSGTVKDEKRQPLAGASVQIENSSVATMTDEFGRFRLEKLAGGEYSVRIRFLGYEDNVEKIQVTQDTRVEITLIESVQLTDEVIVYATRANEKTPTTFTNVSGRALQKQNFGQDLPFLLNWTPSLVTTSDAGAGIGYTGLRIRGSDATRINVTINGIPYNDSESQGTFWVNIPDIASSTQSVQIQRGVGTSTNGAGSFGGSVNVQTISQQRDPYAELMMSAGSFNSQRYTVKAGTGLINNRWSFDGRASRITSDGYIDRATSDLTSYYLSGGYYGDKTILKGIFFGGHEKTYQSWNGIDEATMKTDRTFNSAGVLYDKNWNVIGYYDNEVDDYRQDHTQLHLTQRLSDFWNANVSLHYTAGRGYYEQYKQAKPFAELGLDDLVIGDSTLTYGDFIIRKWLDNKFYGTTFSLNYEKEKTAWSIGGGYNQYAKAKHFGEIIWAQYSSNAQIRQHYYDGESKKNDFNMYVKWNYNFTAKLNAFVDLQYRHVEYKTAGTDDDLNPYAFENNLNFFNPKAGMSYTLTDGNVLYASYAVANREPNRTDYLDGDKKPKPEELDNIEAGWRMNSDRYNLEVNYYWMNYRDQLVLTGELDNVGNPIRANVGKSYRTGVELSGSIKLNDQLTWTANVTGSVNKNRDYVTDENDLANTKNTNIILSPNWIAGSQLSWNVFRNFQASLLSKYVGEQYLDNTETKNLMLDSYFINDLRVSYSFQLKEIKAMELSLLVNNVFDVEYASNGYSYDGAPYYYPQAGRNFMAMMLLRF